MPSITFQPSIITQSPYTIGDSAAFDQAWVNPSNGITEDGVIASVDFDNDTIQNSPRGAWGEFSQFLDYSNLGIIIGSTLPDNIEVTHIRLRAKIALISNASPNSVYYIASPNNVAAGAEGGPGTNRVVISGGTLVWYEVVYIPDEFFELIQLQDIVLRSSYQHSASGTGNAVVNVDHAEVTIDYLELDSEFWTEFNGTTEILT